MRFFYPAPDCRGPSEEDIATERSKWRDEVHATKGKEQKIIAIAREGERVSKRANETANEASRTAKDAIQILEQRRKSR